MKGLIRSMRPHQWIKNAFVLAPLVFGMQLLAVEQALRAAAIFAAFCALASAVYLLNDCIDVAGDRAHPLKRHRPIAAGVVPVATARRVAAGLAVLGLAAAFVIDWRAGIVCFAYLTQNAAYSAGLKNVAWVDVLIIAGGFLLRVLAGAFAISVPLSIWIIACTFLLALYLALGKRRHELLSSEGSGSTQRLVLQYYREHRVRALMIAVAVCTFGAYSAYTWETRVTNAFGTELLPVTIPFIVIGLGRFFQLSGDTSRGRSPTEAIVKDNVFVGNMLVWSALIVALIYFL